MSQDIPDTARTLYLGSGCCGFRGGGPGGSAEGLVVAVGVEGEVAEEFAGGGVDDSHVEVGDEHHDSGSGVFVAEADVVEAAVVAEGDASGLVDAVVADPVVGVAAAVGGGGFGAGGVGDGGGGPLGEGAVRSLGVVDADEAVEEGLELGDGGGLVGLGASQVFRVCWNRSTLPQVVGWLGREFFCMMPRRRSSASKPLRPPLAAGQAGGEHHAVVGQRRRGRPVQGDRGAEGVHHDGAGDAAVGGDRQGVAGVVVEPGQDLGVGRRR